MNKTNNLTNKMTKFFPILILLSLLMYGCNPSLTVNITSEDSVSLEFSSGLGETVKETLYTITGVEEGSPLFDKTAVRQNLLTAGLPTEIVNIDQNNLYLKTSPVSMEEMEAVAPGIIEEFSSTYMRLSLSPERIQNFTSIFPEDTLGYIDLLCAPIFTMEELTTEEYAEVLGAIYGKTLANEAMESEFEITIRVPNDMEILDIGIADLPYAKAKINKNSAKILVSLADFLCNLKDSTIHISWRKIN